MARFGNFEEIKIENKDKKRKITIDGKELDLSEVRRLSIDISMDGIQIDTESSKFLGW